MSLVLDLAWFFISETCRVRTSISSLDGSLVDSTLSWLNMPCLTLDQRSVDLALLSLCGACLVYTFCGVSVDLLNTSSTHPFW